MHVIRNNYGFTLIELAMVLFILGLLLTSILPPLATSIEQDERKKTKELIDEIEQVLYGFALREGRLPCPDCTAVGGNCVLADINDGVEDRFGPVNDLECKTVIGNLPWTDLGVRGEDEWGQNFMYRVTESFADDDDGTPLQASCLNVIATQNVSFSFCSDGDITVNDDAAIAIAQNIPALVFSTGINFNEVGSALEQENTNGDALFVDTDYSDDYDDILLWLSPRVLATKMLQAGILP